MVHTDELDIYFTGNIYEIEKAIYKHRIDKWMVIWEVHFKETS